MYHIYLTINNTAQSNQKNLDLSDKTDLDFWNCFESKRKKKSYCRINTGLSYISLDTKEGETCILE